MAATTLWRNARLATLADNTDWGLVDNGALLVQSDRLAWVGLVLMGLFSSLLVFTLLYDY